MCHPTQKGTQFFTTKKKRNLYKINLSEESNQNVACLLSIKGNLWVWHKKLGDASLRLISKLQRHNLMKGLPRISYEDDLFCETCEKGK